jgi:putative phosphoesterase
MLIGIMADTHDNLPATKDAVGRLNREGVELVLHAGDIIAPFVIGTLKDLSAPMVGVFGNNDGDKELLQKKCAEHPHLSLRGTFARLTEGDLSLALIHGSDRELLDVLVFSGSFDLVVSGHTHMAEVRTQGRTLSVNPGEVCGYLSGTGTVALFDTERRHAEILQLP